MGFHAGLHAGFHAGLHPGLHDGDQDGLLIKGFVGCGVVVVRFYWIGGFVGYSWVHLHCQWGSVPLMVAEKDDLRGLAFL